MAAGIPVLAAGSVQEVYDYGLAGLAISRFAGVWVALKLVTDVAESTAVIDLDAPASRIVIPADFRHAAGRRAPARAGLADLPGRTPDALPPAGRAGGGAGEWT